ncbi:MAG: response regulator transcription factor [Desulfovibrio sp.]
MRVLIVEDNVDLAANICDFLEIGGCTTDYAADGALGLHLALTNEYDAIVLDLRLPVMDGMDVCKEIRQSAALQPPILMLTARDALEDKLAGFDAGADDYLVKPFALEELSARLKALTIRSRREAPSLLEVGPLVMNLGRKTVQRDGVPIDLNRTGFEILKKLMEVYPNVLSRKELEYALWGEDLPDSDALRSHIYKLRNKVDKAFDFPLIHTVHGVGFRLSSSEES